MHLRLRDCLHSLGCLLCLLLSEGLERGIEVTGHCWVALPASAEFHAGTQEWGNKVSPCMEATM